MTEYEKSAGAVVYCIEKEEPKFLLLKYPTYWGFSKGIIEAGEQIEDTVKREFIEETGIANFKILSGFKEQQKWFFRLHGNLINKEAIYLLIEVPLSEQGNVKISFEHEDFAWLTYAEALERMKVKANKEMLSKAYEIIKEKINKKL